MKILITGGAGFIGLRFARYLTKLKHEVHIIDFIDEIEKKNLRKEFTCYGFDISEKDWLYSVPIDFDAIVHCAAQSGGRVSLENPQIDCLWNCLGTCNVVYFCNKYKIPKLIYTSSMAIYGNRIGAVEESDPNPISYYGVSKLAGEYYVKLVAEHSNLKYTIFRLFATYGSGQDLENLKQGIVSIYYALAQKSDVIEITGNKNRVRCIVHVDDVCDALYLSLTDNRTDNQIINVVNEEVCTPETIINAIGNVINKKLIIKECPGYIGDQTHITGFSDELAYLGWKPKYDLKKGVKEFHEGQK